ncbi:MAG: alpha/beta hydrolase-fold protein [Candidatus Thermochlorobacter sp.]
MEFYELIKESLIALSHLASTSLQQHLLGALWETLRSAHSIPMTSGEEALFLYLGHANTVHWHGDYNQWGQQKGISTAGKRLGKSDLWILEKVFPADARLDYKVVLNEHEWLLDPANPYRCKSGFGHSSELRMPRYHYPLSSLRRPDTPRGTMSETFRLQSRYLGYAVALTVYAPFGYERLSHLPTLYVTDGHEYADDEMGALCVTLDNLLAERRIEPILVVFIDPRNPDNPNENRRLEEYPANPKFLKFVTKEVVPFIDALFRTDAQPQSRAFLGTSFGGLCAAYFGAKASETFQRIGIQSPSFWKYPEIFELYEKQPRLPLQIYMSSGTIHDTAQRARQMREILARKGYDFFYRETNESHSWGTWRGVLEEMLLYFFGKPTAPSRPLRQPEHDTNYKLSALPSTSHIHYALAHREKVTIELYDLRGREIDRLACKFQRRGEHTVDLPQLDSGLYFYRLHIGTLCKTQLFRMA